MLSGTVGTGSRRSGSVARWRGARAPRRRHPRHAEYSEVPMKDEDRERASGEEVVVPVIEEEAEVAGVRPVRTGTVRVNKTVEKEVRQVDATLMRETVDVQHVPVNRVVNEAPSIRREGDTVIVPVVEEELVI